MHRVHSSRHFDDHSAYYHFDHDDAVEDDDFADEGFAGDADTPHSDDTRVENRIPDGKDEEKEEYEDPEEDTQVAEIRGGIPDVRDVEAGPKLKRNQSSRSQRSKDPNLVTWDGPNDPENPKNWSLGRKWAATFVVSSFTFISPVSSSMVAPALTVMSADLGIHSEVEAALILSIFVLAYAVGPLCE